MNFRKQTAMGKVIDKIPKLKGPNKAQRGAILWMASAFANQDAGRQRRSSRIAHRMQASLQNAFHDTDPQFIGDVVADIESLWSLGQKLDSDLKELFRMRFPRHLNRLHSFLIDLETRELDEASYLIRRLRKKLPTLYKALDHLERGRRGPRTRLPRSAPKSNGART
jgi:hypothetical protein